MLYVRRCWRRFLFWGSSWIRVVFPFVIPSGMSVSCRHLFISRMEGNFLNQYLCMPSSSGVFHWDTFLGLLWVNRCVFSPSILLWVLLTLFSCCLSIRLFCYVLFITMFCSKIVLLVCVAAFIPYFLIESFFVGLECLVLSVLFYTVSISF